METRTLVELSSKAVDAVLGFRVSAFTPKAFINIRSIKTMTANDIRGLCKQPGYAGEVPLVNVVEVVGNAVSSAAERWNKAVDPSNHINKDWLRHCVCDLVGGAVTHAVFEENKRLQAALYEEEEEPEYLDPAGESYGEEISDATISPLNLDSANDGLQPVQNDAETSPVVHDVAVSRNQVSHSTWATVNSHMHSIAAVAPTNTVDADTLSRKRSVPCMSTSDNERSEEDSTNPKRRRSMEGSTAASVLMVVEDGNEVVEEEEDDDSQLIANDMPQQRRKSYNKTPWTPAESDLLVNTRDSGKTWNEVHVSFKNRTRAAIMTKYRQLKDGK